jgi:hypothetical protein
MSRSLLGIIAAVLLAMGGFTALLGPGGNNATGFAGGCIRVGLVLGALWLALPQIQAAIKGAPRWLLGWFVGKGKPNDNATGGEPKVRERRPRRRSRG